MQLVLIKLSARNQEAVKVQEVLTQHGCDIAVRLGLHETGGKDCSNEGLIILQTTPEQQVVNALTADLQAIAGVTVKPVSI